MMRFLSPEWLLLLPLLAFAQWMWPRLALLRPLRVLCLALLFFILIQPQVRYKSDGLDLWVLVDRSDSAKDIIQPHLPEWEMLLEKSKGADDRLRFVDFAGEALSRGALVRAGSSATDFEGVTNATRTASAIRFALSQMEPGRASRLLLISDGFSTEPLDNLSERMQRQEVPFDYRLAGASIADDVRLASFVVPHRVLPREAFLLEIVATCVADQTVPVELFRNGTSIGKRELKIRQGTGRLRLMDRINTPGAVRYEARLLPAKDSLPGNNAATQWVEVQSGPRLLLVTSYDHDPLGTALRSQGFEVEETTALSQLHVGMLTSVKAVILNNVPAYRMNNEFIQALKFFVTEQAGGLMMAGGKSSFASGGWFGSSIDALLPVSMELKQEHRKLAVAVAIVIDRSGSMSMTAPGTNLQKIQLANEGAARAIELLGDSDQVCIIPTDSEAHVLSPLAPLGPNRSQIIGITRRIESQGGGIFVYTGLKAAWKELQMAEVGQRHVILFADAADAEEPNQYVKLLADMVQNKCTVSVIGMGAETDIDAAFLKDVADKGKGRIFFQADAREIPAVFEQETVAIARSQFIDSAVPVQGAPSWMELASTPITWLPQADGYNLCYLRPGAAQAAVSGDEYAAPLVAFWQRGAGRVGAITFPLGGDFSEKTRAWPQYADLAQSMARWLMGEVMPDGLGMKTTIDGSRLQADLFYDDTWNERITASPPQLIIATGTGGTNINQPWERLAPGHFRSSIEMPGDQWLRGAVRIGSHALPFGPINAAMNPEWNFDRARVDEIKALAQRTGGGERVDLSDIWKAPRAPAWHGLEVWLLIALLAALLAEAWHTRIGRRVE